MPTVAIVGAGFCGSMLATHLLRRSDSSLKVVLIERRQKLGRGLAYSTQQSYHLLNVPAGRMSALPDDPQHFVAWLGRRQPIINGKELGSDSYVPRSLYGEYIESLLRSAADETGRLTVVSDRAIALKVESGQPRIHLSKKGALIADRLVLALGNLPPSDPVEKRFVETAAARYIADPWLGDVVDKVPSEARVLLIGLGLTMADVASQLIQNKHRGSIAALSRHGLASQRHSPQAPGARVALPEVDGSPLTVRRLFQALLRHREPADGTWRGLIDGLRPITQRLWQELPDAERARFLRHLRALWDVHRHRLAPETAALIDPARTSRQLKTYAGRIEDCSKTPDGFAVQIRPRGSSVSVTLPADYIINCTGPASDYRLVGDPFVRSLLSQGLARTDPLHLGFDVDSNLGLVASNGEPSSMLYAVGPPVKGRFWEITAVPELRVQVATLAQTLAESQFKSPAHV
jgi:uncharacterized NAD(P)/FAD-binding protein YdhS